MTLLRFWRGKIFLTAHKTKTLVNIFVAKIIIVKCVLFFFFKTCEIMRETWPDHTHQPQEPENIVVDDL